MVLCRRLSTPKQIGLQLPTLQERAKNGDVLLTNGGGPLQHTFPGCTEPEAAELIGVPKVDVMFFISNDGRIDAVGSRAEEMKALLEV